MCGIVGLAGTIHNNEKDAFHDMLIFSQVRGPHSTGVASVSRGNDQEVRVAKVLGRPDMLIDYDKRWDNVVGFGKRMILGHNRFATVGKINAKCAHPYNFENIVGCHNGTIPEYRLRNMKEDYTKYGTDSEAVLANIDKFPLQEVMRDLSGAWAFVWYDRRDDTLNMYRNDDRYLCYVYDESRKTIFWASERGFIEAACARNKIKIGTVWEVAPHQHIRWKIPEANSQFDKARQVKILSNQWEQAAGTVFNSFGKEVPAHQQANASQIINLSDLRKDKEHQSSPFKTVKDFESHQNLQNLDGQGYLKKGRDRQFYRGFRGDLLPKAEFERLTKDGCCWCDASSTWGQPVRFLNKDTHLCLECNDDTSVRMTCGLKK